MSREQRLGRTLAANRRPQRDDPRFTAWVQRMKEDLARQRERVEAEGIAAVLDSMIATGSKAPKNVLIG